MAEGNGEKAVRLYWDLVDQAYGKTTQTVDVRAGRREELEAMSDEQLAAELAAMWKRLALGPGDAEELPEEGGLGTPGTPRTDQTREPPISAVAELVPEPDNPADPQAIGVHIEGRPVGYLGRAEAARRHDVVEATRRVSGAATCLAVIGGGWDRGGGDIGSLGVVVFLPDER